MNEHCKGGFVKTVIGGNAERKCSVSPTAGRTFLGNAFPRFGNKLTFFDTALEFQSGNHQKNTENTMDNELISRIAELLEQVSDENEFLYRKSTGEIIDRNPEFIDERTLEYIEVNEQDYILLPTQYDIHEYQIMKDFALECPYEQMRDRMLASLRGSGAFRRFKDAVYYLGIRDDWFAYRTKRFSEIAEQWCIQNGLL